MFQEISVSLDEDYTLQPAGRSAPRIIEDILRYFPGPRQFAFTPLAASASPILRSHFSAVVIASLHLVYHESTPLGSRLYALLYDNNRCCHLYVDLEDGVPLAPGEMHDFHLMQFDSPPLNDPKTEVYQYRCSITAARLKLTFRGEEFSAEDLADFEPEAIEQRYHEFKEKFPENPQNPKKPKQDGVPTPLTCFGTLYKIIDKPLNSPGISTIHSSNQTLNLRVNPVNMLPKLHFTLDENEEVWVPPEVYEPVSPSDFEIQESLIRKQHETAFHMNRLHATVVPFVFADMIPALRDMLKADNYPSVKRSDYLSTVQFGAYVALGAVDDFSDTLIISRYEIQCQQDPVKAPYYFEALKTIAQQRRSEQLELKVMELMSLGSVTVSDLNNAYEKFYLTPDSDLDEDVLIATYKKLIQDQPSSAQTFKDALKVISNHLRSKRIDLFLQNDSLTLDEAYNKLGIAATITNDEFIHLAYETKLQDCKPPDDIVLNNALLTVAKARSSDLLFARYEAATENQMPPITLEEAYSLIGTNRTTAPEDHIAVFKLRVKDSPDDVIAFRRALKLIGQDLNSKKIENFLTGNPGSDVTKNRELPVGLENIGNTCYLNSLLQYYFTITPLRESVLTFGNNKVEDLIDMSDEEKREKRVGGRAVSTAEVRRSEEFVKNLEELFQELIHTPKSAISPKKDLAYLALVPSWEDVETEEVKAPLPGPLPEPSKVEEPKDVTMTNHTLEVDEISSSDSHSGVEQDTPDSETSRDDATMSDMPPTKPSIAEPSLVVEEKGPVPPPLPARITENSNLSVPLPVQLLTPDSNESKTEERSRKIDMTLFGRQQDVTECIENVLFQMEAAFKPTGFDEDGEQIDIVKELFYGKTKQTLESEADGSNHREKTERFSSLLVDVAEGPRDLYDALDSYFGEDIMKLEDGATRRTVTIAQLPPVLQVQIQRVQFDRVMNQPFKSNALLKFDETIYMDRYLDSDDRELKRKRREVSNWRIEKAKLVKRLADLNSRMVSHLHIINC